MFQIDLSSGLSGRRDSLRVLAATALGLGTGVPRIASAAPAVPAEKVSVSPQPSPLTLARHVPNDWDPQGWLISEKLDGVRAWWDGRDLRFRSGKPIVAPRWFLADLPAHPLDGELWLGRGTFEALVSAVRRQSPTDAAWRSVGFHVFESPGSPGTFANRLADLSERWHRQPSSIWRVTPQKVMSDRAAVQDWLSQVLQQGGEGLMAHRLDAVYESGRSDALLKIKARQDDEAWVIDHLPGQGRLSGQIGALKVRNRAGVEFELGSGLTEDIRHHPPEPGQLVTYRYQGLTAQGVPRFASFWRVCPDL
jgi:DNA ligase 1